MTHSARILVVACLAWCTASGFDGRESRANAQTAATGGVALVGGALFDGTGGPVINNSVVLIRGARIDAIGTIATLAVPPGYERISTEGLTLVPGLVDLHTHLLYAGHQDIAGWHRAYTSRFEKEIMPASAAQLLLAGVTSARDLGAPPEAIFAVRERIATGAIPGPTLYASGPQLTGALPEWARFYRWPVTSPEEARQAVGRLVTEGADVVKITDAEPMALENIRAIVDAAHAAGLRVAAHGRTNGEILQGLRGGVDEFEHIGNLATGEEYPPAIIAALKERAAAGRPVFWAPTVNSLLSPQYLRANREALDDPAAYRGLPEDIAAFVKQGLATYEFAWDPATPRMVRRKVDQLRAAGVRLLVGTDGGPQGFLHINNLAYELDGWVRVLDVEPADVIVAATRGASEYLGVDRDYGTIAAGKFADIVAVRGDPLRDVGALRDPVLVLKHGRRYK